jgi:hypothetical protein
METPRTLGQGRWVVGKQTPAIAARGARWLTTEQRHGLAEMLPMAAQEQNAKRSDANTST